jgi:hypothetical protein
MNPADGKALSIGCGAGFSGDRVDAAPPVVRTLIERGGPAVMMFEMLAERTLALAQLAKKANPDAGFEVLLDLELRPILADCLGNGITIVGNWCRQSARRRAADPRLAKNSGLRRRESPWSKATTSRRRRDGQIIRTCLKEDFDERRFICANVYQGVPIAAAIRDGAQIVDHRARGRSFAALARDRALRLGAGPVGPSLAGGTMAGHMLECGAQVTGGYFADPGMKDVPDLHNVGFPIAEVAADGSCIVTKASNTGGLVSARTVKEQLLYEIHDPGRYLTPDVVADVNPPVTEVGPNAVRLGRARHPARRR